MLQKYVKTFHQQSSNTSCRSSVTSADKICDTLPTTTLQGAVEGWKDLVAEENVRNLGEITAESGRTSHCRPCWLSLTIGTFRSFVLAPNDALESRE